MSAGATVTVTATRRSSSCSRHAAATSRPWSGSSAGIATSSGASWPRRLEPELRGRFDPSDVVQEAQIEALERLPDYVGRRPMPFRDWLFRTAFQRLSKLRQHAQAARRDVGRERGPVYG